MSLTSEQIARAVIRDSKKRGDALWTNLPGEIRNWLHSTPWFHLRYPSQKEQADLYWRVRTRAIQQLRPKKTKKAPRQKVDNRQKSFDL